MKDLNTKRLFLACFLTLIAAGIGFSIRGVGLLAAWSSNFGFTLTELGTITGVGLAGFGVTIIILSFIVDYIGYGPLMILAFLLHLSSALVTLAATPVFGAYGKDATFWCLNLGMFLFALGNGTCEAVINPLTATLFPREKTHWLNILHAGWPGGLVLGALFVLAFNAIGNVRWEIQMAVFLIPTLAYGALMIGCKFPKSEATASGVPITAMFMEFLAPLLIVLFILQAMVGYVELGTDSWIGNITGRILEKSDYGTMLFIWTSSLMFVLRFFAGPIVHRISPLGLLFASALVGCTGLLMIGGSGFLKLDRVSPVLCGLCCILAATVYGFGKTFLWPTMLGVASERFPKGGAMTLGMMGGIGMLSAGLLGGPGIGYKQDYFASRQLKEKSPETSDRYKSEEANSFLWFPKIFGLDGSKVATLENEGKNLTADIELLRKEKREDKNLEKLYLWWEGTSEAPGAKAFKAQDKDPVVDARLYGGTMALIVTAAIPATMAVGYLLLILYFRFTGGYKAIHLTADPHLPDEGGYAPSSKLYGEPHAITDGIPGEGVQSTPQ